MIINIKCVTVSSFSLKSIRSTANKQMANKEILPDLVRQLEQARGGIEKPS